MKKILEVASSLPIKTKDLTGKFVNGKVNIYSVQDLWDGKGELKRIPVPLLTDEDLWVFNNTQHTQISLIKDIEKIVHAKLEYPIILYPDMVLADGFHRVLKSNIEEKKFLTAKILAKEPNPIKVISVDEYKKIWQKN